MTGGSTTPLRLRDASSSEVVWTIERTGWRALTSQADVVVAASAAAIEAVDVTTGVVRWSRPLDEGPVRLTIDRGVVFVVAAQVMSAHGLDDGHPIWRVDLGGPASSAPVADAARVFVGLAAGTLVALDRTSGAVTWSVPLDAVAEAVVASRSRLFVTERGGTACAYGHDGNRRWCFPFAIPIVGAPATDDRYLYVAVLDNTVRVLDQGNGALRRQDRLPGRPAGGPFLMGPLSLTPLTNGDLASFDAAGKGRPPVKAANPESSQQLQRLSVAPGAAAVAALTLAPGGTQTLAYFRPPAPPAAPAAPAQAPAQAPPPAAPAADAR